MANDELASAQIDAILAGLPDDQRAALQSLRETIAAAAPEAVEAISYALPAFRYRGRPLVSFGAAKAHVAFYVMSPAAMEAHKSLFAGYDTTKGASASNRTGPCRRSWSRPWSRRGWPRRTPPQRSAEVASDAGPAHPWHRCVCNEIASGGRTMPDANPFEDQLIAEMRSNDGKVVSGPLAGHPLLIMTSKGSKTGEPRRAILTYHRDGDDYIVAGTAGGSRTDPALAAQPGGRPPRDHRGGQSAASTRRRRSSGRDERDRPLGRSRQGLAVVRRLPRPDGARDPDRAPDADQDGLIRPSRGRSLTAGLTDDFITILL